jgi:transmembrane sensor
MEEGKEIKDSWVSFLSGETEEIPEQDVTNLDEFREIEKTWDLTGTAYSYRMADPEKAWTRLSEKMSEPRVVPVQRFSYLRYAAIFVALFTVGSILFLLLRNPDKIQEKLTLASSSTKIIRTNSTPSGLTTVTLPDGTTVTLNAGTELKYPEKFTAKERIVRLSGEAYFDVVHDAAHPFVVETGNLRVEDLGTSFNISAYPGQGHVEVNVTSGRVRLSDRQKNESTVIVAGSNGKYSNQKGSIQVTDELTPNYRSWITRELSFHHTPLSEVFEQLQNIYHVPIEFTDSSIATISYTANFDKFELDDIVDVIANTHHLSVSREAGKLIFALK